MPERHKSNSNHQIRRITLNRAATVAFGACLSAKSKLCGSICFDGMIPCLRSGILPSNRSDVLMDHSLLLKAAFDPHIVEVGKK